jgi:hypothetical protein
MLVMRRAHDIEIGPAPRRGGPSRSALRALVMAGAAACMAIGLAGIDPGAAGASTPEPTMATDGPDPFVLADRGSLWLFTTQVVADVPRV